MKNLFKNFGAVIVLFIVFAVALTFVNNPLEKPEEVTISRVVELINTEQVERIEINENTLTVTQKDNDTKLEARKQPENSFSEQVADLGVDQSKLDTIEIKVNEPSGFTYFLTTILPFLIPLIFIGVFVWFMFRQVQGNNKKALSFGQSNVRQVDPEKGTRVTFQDVAGAHEAKEELEEIVEFLKEPKKFTDLGAKIPKGVLLLGPPGTGKTLLARAVAGEAGVPFFNISGSEFVEMFVGVGASRVRDLFKKAMRTAPAIIFIDEIDAVGRQRGAGLGGSHDEREQTLNQILIEMDGFENDTNVIVIAATNRPDVLDPALLRPGRFDRRVVIDRPDVKEREAILRVHARNKPLDKSVDLQLIAQRTPGFSGADLMNLLNEAAITTAREDRKKVTMDDVLVSIDKVTLGPERKSKVLSDKEKEITAYHEGGHALVGHLLDNADPVHKVSIVSRGMAGGYTLNLPEEDRNYQSRAEFLDTLAIMMGGFAAEKLIFGDTTTGPSNDLQKASELARKLVTRWGMSKLGPITFGNNEEMVFLGREIHENRNYSESVAKDIDNAVRELLEDAHKRAVKLLEDNQPQLKLIADTLLKVETLEKDEFAGLMDGTWKPEDEEEKESKPKKDKTSEKKDDTNKKTS